MRHCLLRVNAPLSNMDEFADALSRKQGDAMVREQRCRGW